MKNKFIGLLFFLSLFSEQVFSAQGYTLGANASLSVNEYGVCKTITNASSASHFIATGQSADWSSFVANTPAGITLSNCVTTDWSSGAWSVCSNNCNSGTRSRTVTCVNSSGVTVPDANCTNPKPATSESCNVGVTSSCADAPNVCSGVTFSSANSCNTPTCTGTKTAVPASWGSWSAWSSWNDPGPAACNASCVRVQTQSRSRSCVAGNGCGATTCSGPTTAAGGVETQTNSQNITCTAGEGACPVNVCNNAVAGKRCAGYTVGQCVTAGQCASLCADCLSKSCRYQTYPQGLTCPPAAAICN